MLEGIKNYLKKKAGMPAEISAVEAYDGWSASYDAQPDNLMLKLDEIIFYELIKKVDLEGKVIMDIGCGTGRHWEKLYSRSPMVLKGCDVSMGMLKQLKTKFPSAITYHTKDNTLTEVETNTVDCAVSTLTIAHIKNIDQAIEAWTRILKKGGDLIITDFHPDLLARGGKRTFKQENKLVAVINYVHPVDTIIAIAAKNGCRLVERKERVIDDSLRSYYTAQNAENIFDQFKGTAVIYGLHLKKENDPQ